MLSMLLLLAAPQAATLSDPGPATRPSGPQATMQVYGPATRCNPGPMVTRYPTPPGDSLAWRNGRVALYRLLDRYIDGCPAPIIVRYGVPGSNGVIRELGGGAAPSRNTRPVP